MKLLEKQLNVSRQLALDIARGLSVLFMVMIHTQEYFLNSEDANHLMEEAVDFLGGIPAAPVFMFLMGIGWVYSKRSTPELLLKRGLALFGTGYLLNILRGTFPYLLHFFAGGDAYYAGEAMRQFLYIDILQFSGIALMAFSGIKKYKLETKHILLMIFGLIVLNGFITSYCQLEKTVALPPAALQALPWLVPFFIRLLKIHIIGLFVGFGELSFFPFLTWMVYPLSGYLYGCGLVRTEYKQRFYTIWGVVGAVLFFSLTYFVDEVLGHANRLYSDTLYYHHQGTENIITIGFVLFFIGLCHWVAKIIHHSLQRTLIRWSANVTDIYFTHWIILGWLGALMGYGTLPTLYYISLVVLIMWISDRMTSRV